MTASYDLAPFDNSCFHQDTFAEIEVGDHVDYWGKARPVIEHVLFQDGRVRIVVTNENGGRDIAVAPGDAKLWRQPREGEPHGNV
ncbi:hypothetical protein AB0C93_37835 [Streptomyces sp. NPDC048518]|uniref:hypothetical protein n=1 Tax=Streptomyces sp. NPDC048518 TaxID=3155029 RepID=UPI0033D524EB